MIWYITWSTKDAVCIKRRVPSLFGFGWLPACTCTCAAADRDAAAAAIAVGTTHTPDRSQAHARNDQPREKSSAAMTRLVTMRDQRDDDHESETHDYAFVPEHLRHHFRVDFLNGDAQEQNDVRCARRTRSAHLVSNALAAPPAATKATSSRVAPPPGATLYSLSIERAITARMTFGRTLARLTDYFEDTSSRLKSLDEAQSTATVPAWLYNTSVKLPTLLQVQRHVIQAVESCLSDSDIYLAMFEPLPSPPAVAPTPRLCFAVCSSKSSMAHKIIVKAGGSELSRSRAPRSNQNSEEHASELLNAKAKSSGTTISFEAMESMQEVAIGDIEGYSHTQIRRFTPESTTGPFACFPLLNACSSTAIGVLSLDSCRKARRLRAEAMTVAEVSEFLARKNLKDAARELRRHRIDGRQFLAITERDLSHKPAFSSLLVATRKRMLELIHALKRGAAIHLVRPARYFLDDPDAMAFLRGVSSASGVFLDGYQGVHCLRTMADITRDTACSVCDVYDVLLRGIAQCVDGVERVVIWRIDTQAQVTIDVLASTHVQEDRLVPFVQWNERLIKRLVLFRASSESSANRLVQGTITRLLLPNQELTSSDSTRVNNNEAAMCEAAQYQVSWADRTVERYSWPQLRQLLPIREMNAKHHQLMHLLEQLEAAGRLPDQPHEQCDSEPLVVASSRTPVARLTSPNGVALVVQDAHSSKTAQCVLEVDFAANDGAVPSSALAFLRRAVGVTEKSIACVRGRDARRAHRQLSSARVSREFHSMGLTPSADALRALSEVAARVFAEVADNLPGVEVQVAELQSDGAQLRYTFASSGSSLLDKVLDRGQGVSFRCLDTRSPLVVQRGSELSSRLRRLGRRPPPESDGTHEFPYVFLPLVHEDCAVGVFSVNRFVDVSKGRSDEEQPEAGVLQYLETVIQPLATALYLKRRAYALYELQQLAHEPLRSPHQLLFAACRAVKDVLVGAWKVRVVEVNAQRGKTSAVYELSESERALEASSGFRLAAPVRLRTRELLRNTVANHFALDAAGLTELYNAIERQDAADEDDAKKLELLEADSGQGGAGVPESERRRLQNKTVTMKYLQLTLQAESGQADASAHDRISHEKYVSHALTVFLGGKTSHFAGVASLARGHTSVYLTVSSLPQFYAACDHHYVARVAEIASKLMDELHQRVERSRRRVAALDAFRAACEREAAEIEVRLSAAVAQPQDARRRALHVLTPDEERDVEGAMRLQRHLITLLEGVFGKTNVYIGLLEPSLKRIQYTSASSGSVMRGKHLKHGDGVGFQVLDTGAPFVVTQHDIRCGKEGAGGVKLEERLRYFTKDPATRTWPFVSVSIGSFGVLSIDNLERYERLACTPQPELGVVDFLCQLGSELQAAIAAARDASRGARRALRAQALTRIMRSCDDLRTQHSPVYLQTLALQEIEGALNGVDAYVGMVSPLCERLRFTSASSRSCMEGQTVDCMTSASFRVFASQRPLVIPQLRTYCDHQTEATIASNGRLRVFGLRAPSGPFVCVPIPFVGVLSVDSFPGAAGGAYTPHVPESGVVEFVSRVANHLGEHIRAHNALATAKRIPEIFQGNKSTLERALQDVLRQLALNLVAAEEMYVVRVDRRTNREKLPPVASLSRSNVGTLAGISERIFELVQSCLGPAWETAASCFALPDNPEVIVAVLEPTRDVDDDTGSLLPTVLIVRRVDGATWTYDVEFLKSLLPLVNDLIRRVNTRVEGIVARRSALQQIDRLSHRLDELPTQEATRVLQHTVSDALDWIAVALSQERGCDVYMGEREIGGERLTFTCTSRESLMENVSISLTDATNRSLVVIQCLDHKQPSVVHLFDKKNEKLLRSLSPKKCVRAHVVVPMGDDRVLCADSFGVEAFHPTTRRLEADAVQFLTACAQKLNDLIVTIRYKRSYDELVALKATRHPNFRVLFATLLRLVRRDLVVLHSQQVLTLAGDFTGQYHTEAWHAVATRRPIAGGDQHLCYQSHCEAHLVALGIHHEVGVQLPMSNLPRTLDRSRSSLEPAEGLEKRGAFACSCLTTMLDAHFAAPRVALCVYTHDAKSRASAPTAFTATQRQYFFALAAVAADVFTHVYRSCALFSFTHELFFHLRERLGAREGFVARVQDAGVAAGDEVAEGQRGGALCVVVYSSQEAKLPTSSTLRESAAAKIAQFSRSDASIAIFARKKAAPPDARPGAAGTRTAAAASGSTASPSAVADTTPKAKEKAPSSSFFRRPGNLFRSRKAKSHQQEQAHAQAQTPQHSNDTSAPSSEVMKQAAAPLVKYNVLVRSVSAVGQSDVLSFDVEHAGTDGAALLEQVATRVRVDAQSLLSEFLEKTPRGDEETVNPVLGREAGSSAYGVSTGGGVYLFASLAQARRAFQHESLHLETDIRGHLTGVQPTARETIMTGRAGAHSPPPPTAPSIFADDVSAIAQAAMALLEAAMLLVGYRKEALAKMDARALLTEFLRASVAKKLSEANPRDRKQWGAILRARACLQQSHERVAVVYTATVCGATVALQTMWTYAATLVAVVRYLKQLESDAAREKLRVDRRATTLQCFYRVARAKATLAQLRKEFAAARVIQCAFRQHLARRRALFMKWTRAATKIQRAYRLKLLRRKGSRPKRLSDELLAISKQFGGLSSQPSGHEDGGSESVAWRAEMDAFDSFGSYIASRAGKEQLKREESVMAKRMHELAKEREKLPPEERVVEDVKDLFELMDTDGSGELSRDAMREMMARLRIPLAKEEIEDVIDMMDSDHSGAISLAEFLHWFLHELPVLKKRSRDCGVVSRKDWQWVIQNSARAALRKRYRALRVGRAGAAPADVDTREQQAADTVATE